LSNKKNIIYNSFSTNHPHQQQLASRSRTNPQSAHPHHGESQNTRSIFCKTRSSLRRPSAYV